MTFRISEVIATLVLIGMLLAAKHIPNLAHLPLSRMTGVVCFSFAIYLCLGLRRQLIDET